VSHRINSSPNMRRAGFTLIELLVTLAIIAVLASIIAPTLFGNIGDARVNSAKSQLQIIALALDAYRVDVGDYPTTDQGLQSLRSLPADGGSDRWRGPYLRQTVPVDPWGRAYVYIAPGIENPDSYDLYTLGKDGRPGGDGENADITSWNGPVR
jgi:general secretion pathway protein G